MRDKVGKVISGDTTTAGLKPHYVMVNKADLLTDSKEESHVTELSGEQRIREIFGE